MLRLDQEYCGSVTDCCDVGNVPSDYVHCNGFLILLSSC